ncbi:hypothetical protein AQJ23_34935 [Streptomyces antibioticus]|nr:hypothetical protein [Streptomyces antibioticus]KUN20168.1 hypothetical protein AQJ23_34935 [Streptomyces antibioticus]
MRGIDLSVLPWQALMALAVLIWLGKFLLSLTKEIMPTDSKDRLEWWRELFLHRRTRKDNDTQE